MKKNLLALLTALCLIFAAVCLAEEEVQVDVSFEGYSNASGKLYVTWTDEADELDGLGLIGTVGQTIGEMLQNVLQHFANGLPHRADQAEAVEFISFIRPGNIQFAAGIRVAFKRYINLNLLFGQTNGSKDQAKRGQKGKQVLLHGSFLLFCSLQLLMQP